ncbi:MAG: O-antigen polysaccharide polymerase Wzy [Acidobacteria bacterium]|nr:O-antigen polysaccharide polymerase Wzy [Acidobacteriota bacterium]
MTMPPAGQITAPRLHALRERPRFPWPAYVLTVVPTFIVLCFAAPESVPVLTKLLAIAALITCTAPIALYVWQRPNRVPLLEFLLAMYAIAYALPVFICETTSVSLATGGYVTIPDEAVARALVLVILGVLSMVAGFRMAASTHARRLVYHVSLDLVKTRALPALLFTGITSLIVLGLKANRLIIFDSQTTILLNITDIAYAFSLCVAYLLLITKQVGKGWWWYVLMLIGTRALFGAMGGMMSEMVQPLLLLGMLSLQRSARVPWRFVLPVVILIVLLQPIKSEYRRLLWKEGQSASEAVRGTIAGLSHSTSGGVIDNVRASMERIGYLNMFAYVGTVTPDAIPYSNGRTYGYLVVALVPRVVWPDKPIAQQANNDFAIRYGFLAPTSIGTTMTGMPQLDEAYVNFGALGVVVIMLVIGAIYGTIDAVLRADQVLFGNVVLYTLVVIPFMTIENNFAGLVGNILQVGVVKYLMVRSVCTPKCARRNR